MKALLLLFFVPLVATAAGAKPKYWEPTTQGLTRAAPTDGTTEGLNLSGVAGYRVTLCTASGQTLTGGSLLAWVYNMATGLWARSPDKDLAVGTPARRCRTWPNEISSVRLDGYVLYTTSSVTVSSGTVAIPRIDAWTTPLKQVALAVLVLASLIGVASFAQSDISTTTCSDGGGGSCPACAVTDAGFADLCDVLTAGDLAGEYFCLRGDGGTLQNSAAVQLTKAAGTTSYKTCEDTGQQAIIFDLEDRYNTPTYQLPASDMSVCVFLKQDTKVGSPISHYTSSVDKGIQLSLGSSVSFYISDGVSAVGVTGGNTTTGGWQFICGTLDYVGASNNVARTYIWAEQIDSSSAVATPGLDLTNQSWSVGTRFSTNSFINGSMRGALYTEKLLSAADIKRLAKGLTASCF